MLRIRVAAIVLLGSIAAWSVAAPIREPEGLKWRDPDPVMPDSTPLPTGATARLGRFILPVHFQAFSPDGKLIATTHNHNYQSGVQDRIHLWDAVTGEHLRILEGHPTGVMSVAFSPDGTRLASGGIDNALRIWDVKTGKQLGETQEHKGHVYTVRFTPDGKQLVSTSDEVRLWDVATVKEIRKFPKPQTQQYEFFFNSALSPDGKTLATGSPVALRLWNVADGKELHTINENIAPHQQNLVFSADGKSIITNGAGHRLRKWDVETGKPLKNEDTPKGAVLEPARFAANGKVIAWQTPSGYVLADIDTGKEMASVSSSPPAYDTSFALSADGKTFALAKTEGSLRLWDATTGKLSRTVLEAPQAVFGLLFADGGKTLVSLTQDGMRHDWSVADAKEKRQASLSLPEKAIGRKLSADGKWLALVDVDGTLRVWDTATGNEQWKLEKAINVLIIQQNVGVGPVPPGRGPPQPAFRPPAPPPPPPPSFEAVFAFSGDGKMLIGLAKDGTEVNAWDAATGKKISGTKLADGEQCGGVGGDGKIIFATLYGVGAADKLASGGTLLISNAEGNKWTRRVPLPGPEPVAQCIQNVRIAELLSVPNGKTLALVQEVDNINTAAPGLPGRARPHSLTYRILLLDLAGKDAPQAVPIAAGRSVAMTADGKRLAFTQNDAVVVWDRGAEKCRRGETKPDNKATVVTLSPDGKTLATGDGTSILLWDVDKMPEAEAKKSEAARRRPPSAKTLKALAEGGRS